MFSFLSSASPFVLSSFTFVLALTLIVSFGEVAADFGVVFFSTFAFFAAFAFGVLDLDFAEPLVCFFVFGESFSSFSNLIGLVTNAPSSLSTLVSLTGVATLASSTLAFLVGVRDGDFLTGFFGEILADFWGELKSFYLKFQKLILPFLERKSDQRWSAQTAQIVKEKVSQINQPFLNGHIIFFVTANDSPTFFLPFFIHRLYIITE